MGTRSLTILQDENQNDIAVMYRQFDGYPSGHGADLKDFLAPFRVVNGLSGGNMQTTANGADCLAAWVVARFKTEAGGIYLHAAGTRNCWEDYRYDVYPKDGAVYLRVCVVLNAEGDEKELYSGPVSGFDPEMQLSDD